MKMNIQFFGGRGGGSGMGGGSGSLSKQQMDEMGISGVENGKEVIIKDGVKYEKNRWTWLW